MIKGGGEGLTKDFDTLMSILQSIYEIKDEWRKG